MSIYLLGTLFNHQPDMQSANRRFSDLRVRHAAKISRVEIEISSLHRATNRSSLQNALGTRYLKNSHSDVDEMRLRTLASQALLGLHARAISTVRS